jgi:hypothetical protein
VEKYIEGIQLEKQGSLSQGNPHCVPILQVSSTDFLSFPKSADLFPTGIQVGSWCGRYLLLPEQKEIIIFVLVLLLLKRCWRGRGHGSRYRYNSFTRFVHWWFDRLHLSRHGCLLYAFEKIAARLDLKTSRYEPFPPSFPFDLTSLFYAHLCLDRWNDCAYSLPPRPSVSWVHCAVCAGM